MYQHIGKKLKVLAKIWCVLGVLGAAGGAVLLYLKDKPMWMWIATAAGGIIIAVFSSWGIYALGDIHAKLERMEDKLIPKPSYMSYLEQNQPLRGQCEMCGRTTDLINAKIVDGLGTRYRKVCKDCFAKNMCENND